MHDDDIQPESENQQRERILDMLKRRLDLAEANVGAQGLDGLSIDELRKIAAFFAAKDNNKR